MLRRRKKTGSKTGFAYVSRAAYLAVSGLVGSGNLAPPALAI